MSHVLHVVYRLHGEHVCLVAREIRVGLDCLLHVLKLRSLFQFHIHHAAVQSFALGDSHRERVLHALLGTHADAVSHRHSRSEVGVRQSLRRKALHQRAHDRVGTRVPSGGDYRHGVVLLAHGHESRAVVKDACVDVEAVHGVDAEGEDFLGVFLAAACRRGEDCHVHVFQFGDVLHHLIVCEFQRLVLRSVAAHDAGYLKVGRGLESLNRELSDVAVTHYGCSNLFHLLLNGCYC